VYYHNVSPKTLIENNVAYAFQSYGSMNDVSYSLKGEVFGWRLLIAKLSTRLVLANMVQSSRGLDVPFALHKLKILIASVFNCGFSQQVWRNIFLCWMHVADIIFYDRWSHFMLFDSLVKCKKIVQNSLFNLSC
jgi:hypothetical protein